MKKESNAAVRWIIWLIPVDTCFLQSQLNRSQSKPNYETTCRGIRGWKQSRKCRFVATVHRWWVWTVLAALHQLVHFQMWSGSLCSTVLHCAPVWSCSCPCCSLLIEEVLVRGCWMCRFNEHGFRCHSRSSSTRSSCRNVWVLEMASENSPQCYVFE